jgi:hypothetical protein
MGSSLGDIHSIAGRGQSSRSGVPHADGAYEGEPLLTKRRPKALERASRIAIGALSPGDHFELMDGSEGMVLLKGQFEAAPAELKPDPQRPMKLRVPKEKPRRTPGVFEPGVLVVLADVRVILSVNVEVVVR